MSSARLVINAPDENGWRRVRWDGHSIGLAHQLSDIVVFLQEAGLEDAETFDLTSELIKRRGGGPEAWPEPP
ncbi:hypothetical protein [Streptomyces sp. PvR034]|uniref:hypothetical protein n=1 Tax=Streptomyces sp. PvR034 TaxID=3156401 RepID=UPI003393C8BF